MNKYREIDPEQVAKLVGRSDTQQLDSVYEAFNLVKKNSLPLDSWCWATTAAAAYRAGRLSMWRDMARLRRRKPKTPVATYRWAIHRMVDQFREGCHLKRLYELTQYLWREESGDDKDI